MYCKICNSEIKDYGYLTQKYGNPPQRCEKCRRESRSYRAKTSVARELLKQKVVVLGEGFLNALVPEQPAGKHSGPVFSIGGRDFGPWGGAAFEAKYLIHVPDPSVERLLPDTPYDFRLMMKTAAESGDSWLYIVLEPTDEPAKLRLDLKFTRVYKYTLKGFGRQFDETYPIEEPHEEVLSGWSHARSGRYGNRWKLYLAEMSAIYL